MCAKFFDSPRLQGLMAVTHRPTKRFRLFIFSYKRVNIIMLYVLYIESAMTTISYNVWCIVHITKLLFVLFLKLSLTSSLLFS
jgi:hypothetical protein